MFDVRCRLCGVVLHENIFEHPEVLSAQQTALVGREDTVNREVFAGTCLEGLSPNGLCTCCLAIVALCPEHFPVHGEETEDCPDSDEVQVWAADYAEFAAEAGVSPRSSWVYANRAARLRLAGIYFPDRDFGMVQKHLMDDVLILFKDINLT